MDDDDDVSTCPVCYLQFPVPQLQSHANSHFEDDSDIQLAIQISLASSTNSLVHSADTAVVLDHSGKTTTAESVSSRCETSIGCGGMNINEKISYLCQLQIKDNFYEVNDGLINLLTTRLELDYGNSTSLLSGWVDHIQSAKSEVAGWGCGWRNIQMLTSHLLKQRREAREVLFGGCGFVPDIASLQRWLELSWEKGFDAPGSEDFDYNIYGKTSWIGTTECATLFRSFGLRARIVDFCNKELASKTSFPRPNHGGWRTDISIATNKLQVNGPMDKYLLKGDCSTSLVGSTGKERPTHRHGMPRGQHCVIDWVWNYFSDNRSIQLNKNQVIASEKPPLYFQHDGHSRTIVGIQVTSQWKGGQQYNLLIFDPGHITRDLERSLKDNKGWQKLIKRGVHTLQKPHYQICYIDPGIAGAEEMEQLKTLTSDRFEY